MTITLHRWRTRFFGRVFTRLALLLTASMVALCALTWRISQRWLRETADENLRRVTRMAAVSLEGEAAAPDALRRRVDEIRGRIGFRITIIDPKGVVLADSDAHPSEMENHATRPEVISALAGREGHDRRVSRSVGRAFVYSAVPLTVDNRLIGVVRVAAPVEELERREAALLEWIAAALAVALPASLIIAYFLARALSEPVQKVSALAKRLATGDLSTRIEASDIAEVGQVAQSLDQMRAHLADRIREVQQQRQDLEVTLGRLQEGVITVDHEGRVLTANAAARRFLAVADPLFGRPLRDYLSSRGLARIWDDAQTASASELRREVTMTVGGDERTISAVAIRVDLPGTPIAWLLCLRDITELARNVAMKTDFVANASHELRTPVATIRAAADTLAADDLDAAQRRRFLGMIDRSVERLQDLTEDLMHLNRIESPSFEPASSRFRPAEVLNSLVTQFADRAAARRASLTVECDAGEMLGDSRLIELILKNLLDNAVKFIADGGAVALRCHRENGRVRFDVQDDGCGIPMEDQDRVFERFYQVDKSRSQSAGGTGLGLAIAKHAVHALSGEVSLVSEPGHGTTVSFAVPDHT